MPSLINDVIDMDSAGFWLGTFVNVREESALLEAGGVPGGESLEPNERLSRGKQEAVSTLWLLPGFMFV